VLEANHDLIQRQIKDGVKAYKFNMPYGSVPMVDKATGALKMAESYDHTKLHDTHDYLLPTDAAKEKVAQAWMAAERTKKFGKTIYQARKNARTEWRNQAEYEGTPYNEKQRNPWTLVLADLGGKGAHGISDAPIVRETRVRFQAEQLDRVRNAQTFQEAVAAAIPTAHLPEYGTAAHPTWSKDVVSALWDKAQYAVAMNDPMDNYVPKRSIGSSEREYPVHDGYALHQKGWTNEDRTVRGTLHAIAAGSGHADLASIIKPATKEAA
jgi:hypothetical protein